MIEPDVHRSQLGRKPEHYVSTDQQYISQNSPVCYDMVAHTVFTYLHFSATAARAGYYSHLAFAQAVISHRRNSWPFSASLELDSRCETAELALSR